MSIYPVYLFLAVFGLLYSFFLSQETRRSFYLLPAFLFAVISIFLLLPELWAVYLPLELGLHDPWAGWIASFVYRPSVLARFFYGFLLLLGWVLTFRRGNRQ